MKKTFTLLMIFMVGVALLTYVPASSAAEPQPLPKLKAAEVKIPKAAVLAAMERAHGPLTVMCPGARAALLAYNACKKQCAERAEAAPITPAELESCGNITAAQCADMLIAKRAENCIKTPGVGCADEFDKLQKENSECKKCAELKAQTQVAINDVKAKATAVAKAEAALAAAKAAHDTAVRKLRAVVFATGMVCEAAKK